MTEKWDLSDIFASSNDALVESKKALSEYQAFRKKICGKNRLVEADVFPRRQRL